MIYQKNMILPYYDPQEIKFLNINFSNQNNHIDTSDKNNNNNQE